MHSRSALFVRLLADEYEKLASRLRSRRSRQFEGHVTAHRSRNRRGLRALGHQAALVYRPAEHESGQPRSRRSETPDRAVRRDLP